MPNLRHKVPGERSVRLIRAAIFGRAPNRRWHDTFIDLGSSYIRGWNHQGPVAFVRRKRFGSREYYYLVEGRWIHGQCQQQFLSYLGAVGDPEVEKHVAVLKERIGRGHRGRA